MKNKSNLENDKRDQLRPQGNKEKRRAKSHIYLMTEKRNLLKLEKMREKRREGVVPIREKKVRPGEAGAK